MSHFCLLLNAEKYVPENVDLSGDAAERGRWLDLFARQFEVTLEHAAVQYGRSAGKQIAAARETFIGLLDRLRDDPSASPSGHVTLIELDQLREKALRDQRLTDPFARLKDMENARAIDLYPDVVHDLHLLAGEERWLELIRGLFAGSLFDLGNPATMSSAADLPDFAASLEDVRPRPWHVDDFDELVADLDAGSPPSWTKAVVFVDNAGRDLILGVMPLVRELALAGTMIVLAANELPSINDVTADETVTIVEQLAGMDDDLAALIQAGMIEVVSTGSGIPLLDLSDVSDELNEAAADADLVIFVGMGRAVESNFDAELTVDTLRLAVLKDAAVAARLGAEELDCVCKYTPAAPRDEEQADDE